MSSVIDRGQKPNILPTHPADATAPPNDACAGLGPPHTAAGYEPGYPVRNPKKQRQLNWYVRLLTVWFIDASALILMSNALPGLRIDNVHVGFVAVAAVAILNAILYPIVNYFLLSFTVLTLGAASLLLNAAVIWFASSLIPGIAINNLGTALGVVLGVGAINTLLSSLLAIDDENSYYRNIIQRIASRRVPYIQRDCPGIIFLEIDGLSYPVLQRAMRHGHLPTLARWLKQGSHRLVDWECDFSSQTGASQAGILYGDNFNIPAFRWYEKNRQRIMTLSDPRVAAEIERRLSKRQGLLAENGASRGNMFSGDAAKTMFTVSTLTNRPKLRARQFYAYFANPYNIPRLISLALWDVFIEWFAAWRQRVRNVQPRVHRGGVYPLLRLTSAVLLRELSVYTLIGDMYAGVPVVYAGFMGYDEVAHHSGVEAADALAVLYRLDQQFARLEKAAVKAPLRYQFVVLSDHGQTATTPFRQRFGETLEQLVQRLANEHPVSGAISASEGWANLSALLTEVIQTDEYLASRALRSAVKNRLYDDNVVLGPEHVQLDEQRRAVGRKQDHRDKIIVLPSGNLGSIYFTRWRARATLEQINADFPRLIPGLTQHPGIGFVMVQSQQHGPLALGAKGIYFLRNDRVAGEDPLAPFGPNAAAHLRRTNNFSYVADILVNSIYDAAKGEVTAFEDFVGSHGGLGGWQTSAFLMFPAKWPAPTERIVGACGVHKVAKQWLAHMARETIRIQTDKL
ncbi:MAG: phage holin family protein [Caldilineaceae bacterium]